MTAVGKTDSRFISRTRAVFKRLQPLEYSSGSRNKTAVGFSHGSRGFTLIEAVLAVAVIGAGLIGVMYAYQDSLTASLKADQHLVAVNIARETLESIIAKRDNHADGNQGYANVLAAIKGGTYTMADAYGFIGYNVTTKVEEKNPDDDGAVDDFTDDQADSGYARVTVVVTWNLNKPLPEGPDDLKVETMLAKYEF